MSQKKIIAHFNDVNDRVGFLIQEYHRQTEEMQEVREENIKLKQEISDLKEELKNFQNQEKISKIATSVAFGGQGDNEELKRKIDEYIKEIDKCIAHLSE